MIVTAHDTTRHKPDPLPVRHALSALDIAPDRALCSWATPRTTCTPAAAAGTFTGAALWGPFSREQLETAAPHALAAPSAEVPDVAESLAAQPLEPPAVDS